VLNVRGLKRGLYHYASDRHALETLNTRSRSWRVERYLPRQSWYNGASALVFFTAIFARDQWRYEHARAYRAVLIEAGHMCQTCCLTATWLGLAPFCSMALAESALEKDLGLHVCGGRGKHSRKTPDELVAIGDYQHLVEHDLLPDFGRYALDPQFFAGTDAVLLAAGLDHCIHIAACLID